MILTKLSQPVWTSFSLPRFQSLRKEGSKSCGLFLTATHTKLSGVNYRGSFQVACFHSWRVLPGSFVPPLWANSTGTQKSLNILLTAFSMPPGFRHWALLDHKPYYQLNDGCSCKKNLPNAIIKWLLALFKQLSPLLFGVVTKSQSSTSFVDFWEWSGRVLLGCFFQSLICWHEGKAYLSSR